MASLKANATIIGVEHVDYTGKDGVAHDYHVVHYSADPLPDDINIVGGYAKNARFEGDVEGLVPGVRVRLLWENDPKWNRSLLTDIIPVD